MNKDTLHSPESRREDGNLIRVRYAAGLPILDARSEIVSLLRERQVIVVAGDTGSGKSTQLPLMCIEAGRAAGGAVAVTQPRRIAATSLARQVSRQTGCALGSDVGYRIRFDERARGDSKIVFMTDGILLNDIAADPLLRRYSTIIVDEAHERSLNIDFLLGYFRLLLPQRPDLRLIISSATIDTALFAEAFDGAPVVEVSGRMYPVDVWYQPIDDGPEARGGACYVDVAVEAVASLVDLGEPGDLLVFMPTERDIIETANQLTGRRLPGSLVLPLYGRMPPAMQNRIFDPADRRKIVIATNVAETSITVPGIRFVVDTGLARIKRYAPAQRTSRLPIEPISQASAKQRMGRCGRVAEGVCLRLYSEEDLASRPAYTPPEIRRTNLAGVILQMSAMGLGRAEDFPFVQRPARRAIGGGYALLRELGAVDREGELTALGRRMARFPLDPQVARMLLRAKEEGAVREVKIIAAGLSIVDPRERPAERRGEADDRHASFADPRSDFMTLVKLWDAFHDGWEKLGSQRAMRRFCREHFLSYSRMREWTDVHRQIDGILGRVKGFGGGGGAASYEAVHRSIAAGLIANVAVKEEDGSYRATRNRRVWLFPGSVLFRKRPEWIVCHEIVETSRVYARTAAAIEPEWLETLAPHLVRRHYAEPRFDPENGFVRALETVTLFGLPIVKGRRADFSRVSPDRAEEIFIRQGLVEEELLCRHRFYEKNRAVRRRVAAMEAKLRTRGLSGGDEAVYEFYRSRLKGVRSVHDLNRVIRRRGNDDFLVMNEGDLLVEPAPEDLAAFPDRLSVGGKEFPLRYAFAPAEEHDGVTLALPEKAAAHLNPDTLAWVAPPLWPERIRHLLSQLPKAKRRRLAPLNSTANALAGKLLYGPRRFTEALAELVNREFGLSIEPGELHEEMLPRHLRVRVEVRDADGRVVSAGRGAEAVPEREGSAVGAAERPAEWERAAAPFERTGMISWEVDEVPEMIEVDSGESGGPPQYGFPALCPRGDRVDLLVLTGREAAAAEHARGVELLLAMALAEELAWLRKDLRFPAELKLLCTPYGGDEMFRERMEWMVRRSGLRVRPPVPRDKAAFDSLVAGRLHLLRGAGARALAILKEMLTLASEVRRDVDKHSLHGKSRAYGEIRKELQGVLDAYINRIRGGEVSFPQFEQYPRYLRALRLRVRRAIADPLRYRERMAMVDGFVEEVARMREAAGRHPEGMWLMEEAETMIEELLVSLFAQQEVGTLFPVSEKRMRRRIEDMREMLGE